MLTKELIAKIAAETGMSKAYCEDLLAATTASISDAIRNRDSVQWQGLGVLELKYTAERQMVHPRTGERSIVPAGVKLTFRPATNLKEEMR